MGLDIYSFPNLSPVEREGEETVFLLPNPNFPEQSEGVKKGWYHHGKMYTFRAGSYSGYNEFRDHLRSTLPRAWRLLDMPGYLLPFERLINFSDCDGVINTRSCVRLYDDFRYWRDQFRENPRTTPDYAKTYDQFLKAFQIAAQGNGVVVFA